MKKITLLVITLCISSYAIADIYTFTGPGEWTVAELWDVYPGEFILEGDTVYIEGECQMISEYNFENSGYIEVTATGSLVPGELEQEYAGGYIVNFGEIVNNGTLINLLVENYLEFVNNNEMVGYCSIDNVDDESTIDNNGTMLGEGFINIFGGTMFNNVGGHIEGYFLANGGTLENYGTILGMEEEVLTTIDNEGFLMNGADILNITLINLGGDVENLEDGTFSIFFCDNFSPIINDGYFEISGDMINNDTIFNNNIFINNGYYGGDGVIIGDMENNGIILPGNSPGINEVSGSLTTSAGSTIEIEIEGPSTGGTAGIDYDQLIIGGTAFLQGTLVVLDPLGVDPAIGEVYPVILFNGSDIDPSFDVTGAPLSGNKIWLMEITDTGINLIVSTIVPVDLIDFTAIKKRSSVELSWSTASEVNNQGFYVERSQNGKNWKTLGFVDGKGNTAALTAYTYTDTEPSFGLNYYRLKQQDFDGAIAWSPIRPVEFIGDLRVFPNPVASSLTILGSGDSSFEIINANGKRAMQGNLTNGTIEVNDLVPGIYFLKTLGQHMRFVKN